MSDHSLGSCPPTGSVLQAIEVINPVDLLMSPFMPGGGTDGGGLWLNVVRVILGITNPTKLFHVDKIFFVPISAPKKVTDPHALAERNGG